MGNSFNDEAIEVSLCRGTLRKYHNIKFKNIFPIIHTLPLSRIKTKVILAWLLTFYMLQNYVKLFCFLVKAFLSKGGDLMAEFKVPGFWSRNQLNVCDDFRLRFVLYLFFKTLDLNYEAFLFKSWFMGNLSGKFHFWFHAYIFPRKKDPLVYF